MGDAAEKVEAGPRATLLHDHERLDRLLRALLIRARAGDARDLQGPWQAFETGLRAHLAAEEEDVFPSYAKVRPDDVRALRREHAEIRTLLDAAGFGVELHTARLLMLEDLATRLHEHAEHEDRGLYPFLEGAPRGLWARVRSRLETAMRTSHEAQGDPRGT